MTKIFNEEAVVLIEDLADSGLGSDEHFEDIISDSSHRTEDINDSDSDNSLDVIEVSDNESQCFTRIKPKHESRKTFGNFNRVLIEIYFNFFDLFILYLRKQEFKELFIYSFHHCCHYNYVFFVIFKQLIELLSNHFCRYIKEINF